MGGKVKLGRVKVNVGKVKVKVGKVKVSKVKVKVRLTGRFIPGSALEAPGCSSHWDPCEEV